MLHLLHKSRRPYNSGRFRTNSTSNACFDPRMMGIVLGLGTLILGNGCNHMTSYVNNRAGTIRYNSGQYDLAQEEFQRALANNPRNPDYYHNLAAACCRSGDYVNGEQYYYQALSIDPSHQPSYHNLALLMQQQGREEEAGRLIQGWADTQPDSDSANIELAWYRKNHGDIAGAEQALTQALQVNPKNHIAAANLGELYHEQGRAAEALALYEQSMYRRWDQPQVQSRIASLKTSYPGTMPNHNFVANLSSSSRAQTVNLPNGTGTIESVAAFPLPRFQPNLWGNQFQPASTFTSGTTIVQSPGVQVTPNLTARPMTPPATLMNSDPAHTDIVEAQFEAPSVRR